MESRAMSAKRASISQVMMAVALAAVNLAFLRAVPWDMAIVPTIWVLLGSIDFVFLWKLILKRPLRAFHYTFLIVFVVAWVVTANLVAMERFQPLGLLVRCYQWIATENSQILSPGWIGIGEFWMAGFLCFSLAILTGLAAAGLEPIPSNGVAK